MGILYKPIKDPVPVATRSEVYKPDAKALEYQNKLRDNIVNRRIAGHITPYNTLMSSGQEITTNGTNCIHGVCDVQNKFGGLNVLDKDGKEFVGNGTFKDQKNAAGFYSPNITSVDDLIVGDDLHFRHWQKDIEIDKKRQALYDKYITDANVEGADTEGILNKYTSDNAALEELYNNSPNGKEHSVPYHTSMYGGTELIDGVVKYIVFNNRGDSQMKRFSYSKEEMMEKLSGGGIDPSILVSRYDETKAARAGYYDGYSKRVASGSNEFSGLYENKSNLSYLDNKGSGVKPEINRRTGAVTNLGNKEAYDRTNQQLLDIYNKNYKMYGKSAMMAPEHLDSVFKAVSGIFYKENRNESEIYPGKESTRYDIKSMVPNSWFPVLRNLKGKSDDKYTWSDDYWARDLEGVRAKYGTKERWDEYLSGYQDSKNSGGDYINSPVSKGHWQQKAASKRGKMYGVNLQDNDYGFGADPNAHLEEEMNGAMGLFLDNYESAKKSYPSATHDQLLKVATQMHSAPYKASIPEFFNYYIKNGEADYVNDVSRMTPKYGVDVKRKLGGVLYINKRKKK